MNFSISFFYSDASVDDINSPINLCSVFFLNFKSFIVVSSLLNDSFTVAYRFE